MYASRWCHASRAVTLAAAGAASLAVPALAGAAPTARHAVPARDTVPRGAAEAADGGPVLRVTRAEAIDSALAHNPAVHAASETVAEARAQAVQGAAFPDPSLLGELSGQKSVFRPGTYTGQALALGFDVPFPTKILLERRIGQAGVDATDFGYRQLRQQTADATARAYDALLVAELRNRQLREALDLARSFLAKTRARAKAGTAPGLDVIRARVEVASARNDLLANGQDLADSRAELNRQMGRGLGAGIEPADSLFVPDTVPDLGTLVARAAVSRPELNGLARERVGARAAASLARSFWLPDLSLSFEKDLATDAPTSYTTDLSISVPLFFWNHTRGEVAEASHRVRELDDSYRDAVAAVEQQVRTAYTAAVTARRQALYLRDELVPEARKAFEIATTSYGIGGSSSLEVIDARRTLLDTEGQLAGALGAANDARADLELAVGVALQRVGRPASASSADPGPRAVPRARSSSPAGSPAVHAAGGSPEPPAVRPGIDPLPHGDSHE